jgi:hypothetical protein
MQNLIFNFFYWAMILGLSGGGIHMATKKMRKLALAKPWPSLKMEYKTTTDHNPFVVVKKNGRTYILHEDRMRRSKR